MKPYEISTTYKKIADASISNLKFTIENKDLLTSLLEEQYSQCEVLFQLYYISGTLDDELSKKYNTLNSKWYVYALNAINNEMIGLAAKLICAQSQEYSLYNLLLWLKRDNTHTDIFNNDTLLDALINYFDSEIEPVYSEIVAMRNKYIAHFTEFMKQPNTYKNLTVNTESINSILRVCNKCLKELYLFITNNTICDKYLATSGDTIKLQGQISKFVSLLDADGDLS